MWDRAHSPLVWEEFFSLSCGWRVEIGVWGWVFGGFGWLEGLGGEKVRLPSSEKSSELSV